MVRITVLLLTLLLLSGAAQAQLFLNVNKSFTPNNVVVGGTSALVITLVNTSSVETATLVSGTDTLPSGLALNSAATTTCGFNTTASSLFTGGATLNWSDGTIPPGEVCTITAVVTPVQAGTWLNTIATTDVSGNIGGTALAGFADASVSLVAAGSFLPIVGSKTSSSPALHGGGTQSYTITLTNHNAIPLLGVGFTDTFPAPIVVAVPGGMTSNTCGGAVTNNLGGLLTDGSLGFRLAGATIPANGSCSLTVVIRPASTTQFVHGDFTNSIAANGITSTLGVTNATAFSNTIRVQTGVFINKLFDPTTIFTSGLSTLKLFLRNYTLQTITGASLTDNLPANVNGVSVLSVTPASCLSAGGTVTVSATSVVVNNLSIPPAPANTADFGACAVNVQVSSSIAGAYTNSIGAGSFPGGYDYQGASAILTVRTPVALTGGKGFTPPSVTQNGTTMLSIALFNSASVPATNVSLLDDLLRMGPGFSVASTPPATTTCGGILTAVPGSTSFTLTGGTLAAAPSGSVAICTISVPIAVSALALAAFPTAQVTVNSLPIGSVTSDIGFNTSVIQGQLLIIRDIQVFKGFTPSTLAAGATSTLKITLAHVATGVPAAAITSFADDLATMVSDVFIEANPPPLNTCGGTLVAVPGTKLISMTGGIIPAGGNCQIFVTVIVPLVSDGAGVITNIVPVGNLKTSMGDNTQPARGDLTVQNALLVSKAFSPNVVAPGQVSHATISLSHRDTALPMTGIAFTDVLPAGHTVASPSNSHNNCGGTFTALAGSGAASLVDGVLPAGPTSCTLGFDVVAPLSEGFAQNTIPRGSITTVQGYINLGVASASLSRVNGAPATLNKNFNPPNILGGGSSVLTVLISHTNSFALTNVSLVDTMPSGMVVAPVANASTTCGAGTVLATSGQGTVSLSNGTVPSLANGGTCSFQVNVTSAVGGNSINTIPAGIMTSAQNVSNVNSPAATLQVTSNVNLAKAFLPTVTQAGQTSLLTISVYNSNNVNVVGNNPGTLLDTLPAGLVVAPGPVGNSCGGTINNNAGTALAAGDETIRLDGGLLIANSVCEINVIVTSSLPNSTGTFVNTIAASSVATALGDTNPTAAQATLSFVSSPVVNKAFTPSSLASGSTTNLVVTLSNPNAASLSAVRVTDTLPAGLGVASAGAAAGTCAGAGSNSLSAGQTVLALSGLSVPTAGSCTVIITLLAPATGVFINTITGVVSTQTPVPSTAISTATLTVLIPPSISKSFTPSSIQSDGTGTSTLLITLVNTNATALTLANPSVVDAFPTSPGTMTLASTAVSTTCGGNLRNLSGGTLAIGATGVQLQNGSIPPNSSCTVSVIVNLPKPGTYLNTTGSIVSTNAGSAPGAFATVTVAMVANLSLTKDNGVTELMAGSTTSYTLTVTNLGPANAQGAVLRDLVAPGLSCTSMSCIASGGAVCPANNVGLLQTAGLSIPDLPRDSQIRVILTCGVTATGQ